MRLFITSLFVCCFLSHLRAQPRPEHNLVYTELPTRWEDALPLGNALLGCLVWQKEGKLRLSLDRADLWDLRPLKGLDRPEFSYQWVAEQVAKGNYAQVQEYFDRPYEREAGPTKLPGAALEIGRQVSGQAELDIATGAATITLSGGPSVRVFIHAARPEGWIRIAGGSGQPLPSVVPPDYTKGDLARLGYRQGEVMPRQNGTVYRQPGWNGAAYDVAIAWRQTADGATECVWSMSAQPGRETAEKSVQKALRRGFEASLAESKKWWSDYWSRSSVALPDPVIERQYYLDLYKFGCAARDGAPMINLQSVWTADNGSLPPWKSDFHHDLNTQLSYWPAYASNHLDLALGYLNHLERNKDAHRAYTRRFFGTSGLNVPGVETLAGEPLGGWIQYACSPTTAAWLAQHFYLQWRYSQDRKFLKKQAWPFLRDVAIHLEELSRPKPAGSTPAPGASSLPFRATAGGNGGRALPLSSSPEINDNRATAWFPNSWTNYDLSLARFVFEKTAELAGETGEEKEARKWKKVAGELPDLAQEPEGQLKIAPHLAQHDSHRHFSHLMAIHPLGLLDWEQPAERNIIEKSLQRLDAAGTDAWTGYSFAWLANLRARARNGAGARDALRIFAEAFVSKNSFHLNGDQSGKGYSKDRGTPFTLEGNFAFAAGVQEMLLQSQGGVVRVFPALPPDWKNVSFKNLRAEGAALVGAERKDGRFVRTEVFSEKGGAMQIELPAGKWRMESGSGTEKGGVWHLQIRRGERVVFLPVMQ